MNDRKRRKNLRRERIQASSREWCARARGLTNEHTADVDDYDYGDDDVDDNVDDDGDAVATAVSSIRPNLFLFTHSTDGKLWRE